jgi:hypothetical protein
MQVTSTILAVAGERFRVICTEGDGKGLERLAGVFSSNGSGSLWPMIALIGAAGVVVGIMQALRRKPGTAVVFLLCGACLLGLYSSMAWRDGASASWVVRFEPEASETPPLEPVEIAPALESLEATMNELGPEFRELRPASYTAGSTIRTLCWDSPNCTLRVAKPSAKRWSA